MSPSLRPAAAQLQREVSRGDQFYATDPALYPINEPVAKVESAPQVAGETLYIDDLPRAPGELHGAFVISEVRREKIEEGHIYAYAFEI